MPIPVRQKSHIREKLRGFNGVNLRRDRLSLVDEDLAVALNVDLHTRPGTILLRAGKSKQFSTALSSVAIRRLFKRALTRYQVAGTTLFRDQSSILTGLSGNLFTTLLNARPLNDTSTWTFIADDAVMRKDDGSNVRNWGISPPLATPTIAVGDGTGLTGDYIANYTYVRDVGGTTIHESNAPTSPSAVTLANEDLDIDVVASTDAQVSYINIYRTAAGGSSLLFDQQVANTTATITSSQADSALGTAIETDNDVPNAMSWITEFQGHVFGCRDASNPHYLWWSKRFQPEAFPASNFIELGNPSDPLQCAISLTGFLGVLSRLTKYRVFGNVTSGFTFLEALSSRGTPAPDAVIKTERGCVFPARDGIWLTNFINPDVELSQAIEGLFNGETINDYAPIDWDKTSEMSMAYWKNRLYFGYMDTDGARNMAVYSSDTQRWYFFDHPVKALYVEEDVDQLVAGHPGQGLVYILEDSASTESRTATIETAERAGGDDSIRKRFDYARIDASGTWTVQLYVDGTLRHTFTVSGDRSRQLVRLPAGLLGHTYRFRATHTGTDRSGAFHGAEAIMMPLMAA